MSKANHDSNSGIVAISVSADAFRKALERFEENNPDKSPFVSTDLEYDTMSCYLAVEGNAGVAVAQDGEICSLFNDSAPSGTGKELVEFAISRGGNKLNCFDGFLPEFYSDLGFQESGRISWDDQYAPAGWNYEKFGRPDVVTMELGGEKMMSVGNTEVVADD